MCLVQLNEHLSIDNQSFLADILMMMALFSSKIGWNIVRMVVDCLLEGLINICKFGLSTNNLRRDASEKCLQSYLDALANYLTDGHEVIEHCKSLKESLLLLGSCPLSIKSIVLVFDKSLVIAREPLLRIRFE